MKTLAPEGPLDVVEHSPEVIHAVEKALPSGRRYRLPEEFRVDLAEREVRKESPTSLATFLTCPLKWWLDRYAPIPGATEVSLPGVVGTFVHRVIEVFYSEPANLRTPDLLDATLRVAWKCLRAGEVGDGIVPPDLIEEFQRLEAASDNPTRLRETFLGRAERAIENLLDFDLEPEKVRVVSNESWVRAKVGDVMIRGKIDRIVRAKSGREIIQDYKGLALDTRLPTPTGWTTMGEVAVGDELLGSSGRAVKVTVKSGVHHRECYRVSFESGAEIIADSVHLWSIRDPYTGRPVVVDTETLGAVFRIAEAAEEPYGPVVILGIEPIDLEPVDLGMDPYELGCRLGRGEVTAKNFPPGAFRGAASDRREILRGAIETGGDLDLTSPISTFTGVSAFARETVTELLLTLGHDLAKRPRTKDPVVFPTDYAALTSEPRSVHEVTGVDSIPSVPTSCVGVDAEDSLYLAGPRYTPTHNTGKAPNGAPDVLTPAFLPIGLYAWMRVRSTKDDLLPADVGRVQLLYLTHLKRSSVAITDDLLEKVDLLVHRIVDRMDEIVLTGEIEATPALDRYGDPAEDDVPCRFCPARGFCPAFTGDFDALRKNLEI